MNLWRWIRVLIAYVIVAVGILVFRQTSLMFSSVSGDPLYLNALKPGALYSLFVGVLIVFTMVCIFNLSYSAHATPFEMPRKQFLILAFATLIAGLAAPVSLVAAAFEISIPRVSLALLLGVAVVLIGFGVARYSALMEGRMMRRDFYLQRCNYRLCHIPGFGGHLGFGSGLQCTRCRLHFFGYCCHCFAYCD